MTQEIHKKAPKKASLQDKQRAAFNRTMRQARTHMTPVQTQFSRFVHVRSIESLSDLLGSTILRPIPLICGGLSLIVIAGAIYAAAKYYGYILSGSEPLFAFLFGWLAGMIIDYTRLLVRGRRSHHNR